MTEVVKALEEGRPVTSQTVDQAGALRSPVRTARAARDLGRLCRQALHAVQAALSRPRWWTSCTAPCARSTPSISRHSGLTSSCSAKRRRRSALRSVPRPEDRGSRAAGRANADRTLRGRLPAPGWRRLRGRSRSEEWGRRCRPIRRASSAGRGRASGTVLGGAGFEGRGRVLDGAHSESQPLDHEAQGRQPLLDGGSQKRELLRPHRGGRADGQDAPLERHGARAMGDAAPHGLVPTLEGGGEKPASRPGRARRVKAGSRGARGPVNARSFAALAPFPGSLASSR